MKCLARLFLPVVVLVLWSGCSKPPASDVLKKAQESEEIARRVLDTMRVRPEPKEYFQAIIDDYSRVVDGYETAPEAEVALFRRAAIRNNDTKEHEAAIGDYKVYAQRYPTSEKTPLVMFLIGYIYNNELHNLDSAAAAYTRFLDKYPENEMASSAQFELRTLGKAPEELLPPAPPPEKPARRASAKKST